MYLFFKRVFDIIGSLLLLPFVILEILVMAPIIWMTDKGPVFYNGLRAGKDYKPYKMFKLRSMYVNSPDIKNEDGSTYNSDNDPRVTPIGRLMRRTSIDEFPQIINVLLGHMSFIGPRPKLFMGADFYKGFSDDYKKSFTVKPGITGYAQAFYRNSITQDEKFHWDAYYAEHIGLFMDVKILLHTVSTVLKQKNINTK